MAIRHEFNFDRGSRSSRVHDGRTILDLPRGRAAMITVMNSAVRPAGNFGTYIYSPATVADLARVVHGKLGEWQSAVGYQQNIELIAGWTGVTIQLARIETEFQPGDSAIVMRLKRRVSNPATKGAPVSENPDDWEFAWVHFSH